MKPLDDHPPSEGAPGRLRLRIVATPPGSVPPELELPLVVKDDGPLKIGRLDDNDLVLPDENLHVSRCHCWVDAQDGVWLLQNRSVKNGAWINDKLLGDGEIATIAAGDVIRVVEYVLRVEPDPPHAETEHASELALPQADGLTRLSRSAALPPVARPRDGGQVAPARLPASPEVRDTPPGGGEHATGSVEPLAQAEPRSNQDPVAAFLAGAGLQHLPGDVDPAVAMRSLGEASRVLVRTLSKLLAARQALKSDFRVQPTVIAPGDNDPLALDERRMLGLLLGATPPGVTSGAAAIADACRDLVAHQVALLAGFQAQLDLVMRRLSPAEIAAGLKGGLIGGKGRSWERYEAVYDAVLRDVSNNLAGPLGQAFAAAYRAHARPGD